MDLSLFEMCLNVLIENKMWQPHHLCSLPKELADKILQEKEERPQVKAFEDSMNENVTLDEWLNVLGQVTEHVETYASNSEKREAWIGRMLDWCFNHETGRSLLFSFPTLLKTMVHNIFGYEKKYGGVLKLLTEELYTLLPEFREDVKNYREEEVPLDL
jgi:hypothetical protein